MSFSNICCNVALAFWLCPSQAAWGPSRGPRRAPFPEGAACVFGWVSPGPPRCPFSIPCWSPFSCRKSKERFDICKYNILSDSVLNVVYGLSGKVGAPSRGGPNERFLSASTEPAEGCRRQIFGGREHDLAAWRWFLKKVSAGWWKPRVILGLWSGQGHLSSCIICIFSRVSIISWLLMLYALNGRKVTVWILIRYEKVKI